MTAAPDTVLTAEAALLWLPDPIVSYDSDHTVVYANEAFRHVSLDDPVGMDIETVLDGYDPREGGGFVMPKETDETFVAVVRTPTRVESGTPSETTVLKLQRASADRGTVSTLDERIPRSAEQSSAPGPSERPTAPGPELTADDVLTAMATPVVAHDADGVVTFANTAFRKESTPDPVGAELEELLDGYQPGAGGDYVTPVASERTYRAVVRESVPVEGDGSETVTLLRLRAATPGDSDGGVPVPESEGMERPGGDREGLFEPIVENSNDAIFVMTTTQDEFVYVNERACELLGYGRAELLSLTPRDVHPHDYPTFHEFMETVVEDGSGWTAELSCYHSDGNIIPAEVSASVVELGGRKRLVASVRDVSTRVEQQEQLQRLSRAMAATSEGIALFDLDGVATYANPAFADAVGMEAVEQVTGRSWADLFDDGDRFEMAVRPAAESGDGWQETIQVTVAGEDRAYAISATAFENHIACVARDVTDRNRRRDRLRGLAAASHAFTDSDDTDDVAATTVSVLRETLGFETACFRVYDPDANALQRVAETDAAAELLAEEVAYDMDATRAGRAFKAGERLVIEAGEDAYAAERSHLHVPVGETGVITVASTDGFRDGDADLVEVFAETVRTALVRVGRLERLRDREAELEQQRDELSALVEFSDLVEDVIRSVVSTSTRQETEQAVCDRLAASDRYVGACILDEARTVRAETVTTAAESPVTDEFIESPFADRLLEKATETLAVERRRFDAGEESQTTTAAAIPITYAQQRFGTVVIVTQDSDAFPEAARAGVKLLAETLGFAIVANRSQEALQSKNVTEVEIELSTLFAELTGEYDCRCMLVEVNSTPSGDLETVGKVEGIGAETVRAAFEDRARVQSVTADGPDECTVKLVGSGTVPEVFAEMGANIRSVTAEDGSEYVTAEVPEGVDVSALLSQLDERLGDESVVSLHAQRSRRRLTPNQFLDGDALTDRQREAACAAYDAGYYEWPRERTAEEIAESLDIAASTFHRHLRTAQGKLARELCQEEAGSE